MPPLPKSQAESDHVQDIPPQILSSSASRKSDREPFHATYLPGARMGSSQQHPSQDSVFGAGDTLPIPLIRIHPPPMTRDSQYSVGYSKSKLNDMGGKMSISMSTATQIPGSIGAARSDRVYVTPYPKLERGDRLRVPVARRLRLPKASKNKAPCKPSGKRGKPSEHCTEPRQIIKRHKHWSSPTSQFGLAKIRKLEAAMEKDQRLLEKTGDDASKAGCSEWDSGFDYGFEDALGNSCQAAQSSFTSPSLAPELEKGPPIFTFKVPHECSHSLAAKTSKGPSKATFEVFKKQCIRSNTG
ncbi:hypothetical protein ONS96_006315 [Cadophora gregata f. sp. sojae]|nr:hypothetical protein ONS96_006315 [Cadophora gregata f. sp. sojae]